MRENICWCSSPKADAYLHAVLLLLVTSWRASKIVQVRQTKNVCLVNQCNYPLGMEDGRIHDNQITATAHHVDSSAAHYARLNGVSGAGAWCHSSIDKDERDQYLQVSLSPKVAYVSECDIICTPCASFRLFARLLTNHFGAIALCAAYCNRILTVSSWHLS